MDYLYGKRVEIEDMVGKVFTSVKEKNSEESILIFTMEDGSYYEMYHDQNCCESVHLEDICGDLSLLENSPIIRATEDESQDWEMAKEASGYDVDSHTWTFYNIATAKGVVTLRWYGESNGYYSESVDLFYKQK